MKQANWLRDFRHNVFSQRGEDGIIQAALSFLPPRPLFDKWCVEFGAGDGVTFSNTRNLIANRGYHSVQIEADPAKFTKLDTLYASNLDVNCRHRTVGWGPDDGLDAILDGSGVPSEFDVLSIDIDGNDWYCWGAIKKYRPRLVVIEFNPTIPVWEEWLQPPDPAVNQGCSLGALCALAKCKAYELIAATEFNAVFVLREYFPLFEIADNRPDAVCQDRQFITWVAQGYDGTLIPGGRAEMLWAGRIINMSLWQQQIQVIPESERHYRHRPNQKKEQAQ